MVSLRGTGIDNPYRVRPVRDFPVMVGAEYQHRPILMHNSHNETVHIKEIFTSDAFLLLQLPETAGSAGGHKKIGSGVGGDNLQPRLWELAPKTTKPVINLIFHAQNPGKYQGFVHINTDKDTLIIHVDFTVSKSGVHKLQDHLDFGTLVSPGEVRTRNITLENSGSHPVHITDIYVMDPSNSMITTVPVDDILPGNSDRVVATVTHSAVTEGIWDGTIVVKHNDSSAARKILVPFKCRVLHGSLDYALTNTSFHAKGGAGGAVQTNALYLLNNFKVFPIAT